MFSRSRVVTAIGRPALAHPAPPPRLPTEIWLGGIGAIAVCLGGFSVADIPRNHPGLQDVGLDAITYGHGKTLGAIVFWLGVALMVFAWMRVGRRLCAPVAGDPLLSLTTLRWTVIGWAAPLCVTVPLFSRDVYAYLGQGVVFAAGFDPYADGPAHHPGPVLDSMAQVWASTTAPYGPMFMAITRGVVAVSGEHVLTGVWLMRLVLLPGLLLSLWAVPRLATHFGASPEVGVWLALLNPMVLIHLVGGPHVELLMMGVLAAGLVLTVAGRHISGLAVLGLAVSIKVTAGVAIPFVVWIWLSHIRSERKVTGGDVARVFAVVIAVPVAVFAAWTAALGLGLGWLTGLGWADQIINWFTLPTAAAHLVTLVAAPFTSLNLWPVLTVTRAMGAVCLAIILVALWWRHRADERSAIAGLAWAMLAVLLLEPSTLPWYYTWVLVVAVAFTLPGWVRAVVVGVSTFMLIVFQPDDSIVFYKLPEVALAAALSLLAAISLLRPDPLRLGALARRLWGAEPGGSRR
ncbi:polyprenol phosphomannose-dependent alpha 1,6 mannosyltransferase MptB [Gordonia polyisoprenivorans]|uniref:polyprenol phosphomannose-dependent alpha 1,6 mannosyltransferase MptB n=1 Tax=Gordonia polyisoprenivorans TaxID=84595 RepID=UPI0022348621|nr:polyprenol phosphomannose-dependent alpha 1,6 mannosyltransferase MptB [uncultured Gordonia sp.]UZF54221.1 polyprenol phosphomannose-dependent alpha 1,6 mannosyltransferase MptB [Gordonia polyisoprenivorans]